MEPSNQQVLLWRRGFWKVARGRGGTRRVATLCRQRPQGQKRNRKRANPVMQPVRLATHHTPCAHLATKISPTHGAHATTSNMKHNDGATRSTTHATYLLKAPPGHKHTSICLLVHSLYRCPHVHRFPFFENTPLCYKHTALLPPFEPPLIHALKPFAHAHTAL